MFTFSVRIVEGSSLGPYNIYKESVSNSNFLKLVETDNIAQNVSYSDLTRPAGVEVYSDTPFSKLVVYNTDCLEENVVIVDDEAPVFANTNDFSLVATNLSFELTWNEALDNVAVDYYSLFIENPSGVTSKLTDVNHTGAPTYTLVQVIY